VASRRVRSEMSESKKKSITLINMLERGVPPKIRCVILSYWYIYIVCVGTVRDGGDGEILNP
jgi:hypothetical protein